MVQLRTRRAAVFLYGILLVLPTAVMGALQWRTLTNEHEESRRQLPDRSRSSAGRMQEAIAEDLSYLETAQNKNEFWLYNQVITTEPRNPALLIDSPLTTNPVAGITTWFTALYSTPNEDPQLIWGGDSEDRAFQEYGLRIAAAEFWAGEAALEEQELRRLPAQETSASGLEIAGLMYKPEFRECIAKHRNELDRISIEAFVTSFKLHFFREGDGPLRLFGARLVWWNHISSGGPKKCYADLLKNDLMLQGFFIDPVWFFDELPERAATGLFEDIQHFTKYGEEFCCPGELGTHASFNLLDDVEVLTEKDREVGKITVGIDSSELERAFKDARVRFAVLAGMLILSLMTGIFLLLRSVNQDLEQAHRTENFVASVTHELRTPLSGIKLHAEMLLDGWTAEEKKNEYYRRIVRETDRLSTLVERVLEKNRLASTPAQPIPTDLNEVVAKVSAVLQENPETDVIDVDLELDEDLPHALLTSEAIRSILVNLVENARKYAPVPLHYSEDPNSTRPAQLTGEPILVRTRQGKQGVLLEVLDRGPGIAPRNQDKVFQAFFRLGNEATRTSRGTGLGLHLVALQAQNIGGTASVHARPGGGSIFRIQLKAAPDSAT